MSLTRISDETLKNENRYHITQPDIPGKSAAEMKEFMDYVPRRVIIPKVNEIIDGVYTKAEVDEKLDGYLEKDGDDIKALLKQKADKSDAVSKEELSLELESKADVGDSYTIAETDARLSLKANLKNVYSKKESFNKTEADARFLPSRNIVGKAAISLRYISSEKNSIAAKLYFCASSLDNGSGYFRCYLTDEDEVIAYANSVDSTKLLLFTVAEQDIEVYLSAISNGWFVEEYHPLGYREIPIAEWVSGVLPLRTIESNLEDVLTLTDAGLWLIFGKTSAELGLSVYGKNLWQTPTINANDDTIRKTVNYISPITLSAKTSSDFILSDSTAYRFCIKYADGTLKYAGTPATPLPQTFDASPENPIVEIMSRSYAISSGGYYDIQFELGRSATDYEQYIEPVVYAVNEDGTADGITASAQTVTVMTDADGAFISADYTLDLSAVLDVLLKEV